VNDTILGLHHVTATADDAQADLDCYVGALGLRLVKKTVNFDNHNVYHFYYGDEHGTPGTLMTTFPYRGWGVPVGTQGAGQVTATTFSVPKGSLDGWRTRLSGAGLSPSDVGDRFGDEVVRFLDPSGLVLELLACDDRRVPWIAPGLSAERAVRGVASATLSVRTPEPSIRFLTEVLGWRVTDEEAGRTRLAAGGDVAGHWLEILHAPDAPAAVNGLGTVHHVAMAVADAATQADVRRELVSLGVPVTEVRDRQYFQSIYFREPGGVLYEVATLPPGFTTDEELASLGQDLKLPSWEEPNRPAIERGLPPIRI
jgi:glyoxalase family protein